MDPGYIILFVNLIILVSVLYNLYIEISSILHFSFYRSGDEEPITIRAWRPRVTIQFVLFAVCFCLSILSALYVDGASAAVMTSFACMTIAFFVNGFLFQVCFVSDEGFGSVNDNFSVEVRWHNIRDFKWDGYRLDVTLKSAGFIPRRTFRFTDRETVLEIDRRIKKHTVADEAHES